MGRLILGIFVILLINVEVNAQSPIFISDIWTVLNWGRNLFMVASEIHSWTESADHSEEVNVIKVLNEVKQVSIQLTSMASNIDQKFDSMLFIFMKNSRNNILQSQKLSLNDLINSIDRFYDRTSELRIDRTYSNETLKNFARFILWDSNNVPDVLSRISQIILRKNEQIVPSYLHLMTEDAQENVRYDCNKYISAQQQMYYILTRIILAEMKGFVTLTYAYSIQRITERSYDYITELKNVKDKYEKRVEDYYKYMTEVMEQLPRDVHRCDVDPSKHGIDFFELYQFSRAAIFNVKYLTSGMRDRYPFKGFCGYSCSEIDKHLGLNAQTSGRTIYNCSQFGGPVKVCLAPKGSQREYMWWKNEQGTYGHDTDCNDQVDMSGYKQEGQSLGVPAMPIKCNTCVCSMDIAEFKNISSNEKPVVMINAKPQVSDIINNMVVTGVQFIVKENAVHLQIQQNKFLPGGMPIYKSSWIDPATPNPTTDKLSKRLKWKSSTLRYFKFEHEWKTLYLDDIILPDSYVATGLQFIKKTEHNAFGLQILGTPFDFNTGSLDINGSLWFIPHNGDNSRYQKPKRVKIDMNEPDNPTKCQIYNYDQGTHKSIEFMHTDIRKDAGQSTVPFFDAQPVVTQPAFPLSGVGLFHRGRDGFGGYIAPRIFTINVHKHIKSALNNVTNTALNQNLN